MDSDSENNLCSQVLLDVKMGMVITYYMCKHIV
jgi:hypothetical protein